PESAGDDGGRPQRDHPRLALLHLRDGVRVSPDGGGRRRLDGAVRLRVRPDIDPAAAAPAGRRGVRRTALMRWGGRLITLLTVAGIGLTLLPYFWMLSSSLKTGNEVFELPLRWLPREPQWSNYPNALTRGAFGL